MHGYFVFDVEYKSKRHRMVYVAAPKPSLDDVILALKNESDAPPPESVCFIVPNISSRAEAIQGITKEQLFRDRFPEVTRYFDAPRVHVATFDGEGKLSCDSKIPLEAPLAAAGMTKVFEDRKGLLKAQDGYHYTKPSGKHSQSFLRVGNVMASSVEIEFIAFCCLPYVSGIVSRIYCDTGAIFPVANSISRLREQLNDEAAQCLVESFGSFDGLPDFQFRMPSEAIVLISASTSGGLASAVQGRDSQIPSDKILTLYFLGSTKPEYAICDLGTGNGRIHKALEPFQSADSNKNCELCRKGWSLITLEGDQFLPGESRVDSMVIKGSDAPNGGWLSSFVGNVRGRGIIKAQYSDSEDGSEKPFRLFLDVERLFANDAISSIPELKSRFDWIVEQNVPYTLRRIIHLSDDASFAMAKAVKKKVEAQLGREVQLVVDTDLYADIDGKKIDDGASLIIASAASSGRTLHAVAQVLRVIQPNHQIHYFVGVTRCPTKSRLDELQINLTYGQRRHGFWTLADLYLPLSREGREDAWELERRLLNTLRRKDQLSDQAATFVSSRLRELDEAGSRTVKGLEHNLFLIPNDSGPMELQKGFAFLNFSYDKGQVNQAETFFVVSSVLHNMRTDQKKSRLRQHSFVHKVLSPRCFDRFNDGVIQSSLLRAAVPAEIDYSTNDELSKEMADIIRVMTEQSGNQVGEAAREFALALATKRMVLRDEELRQICGLFCDCNDVVLSAFGKEIRENVIRPANLQVDNSSE